MASYLIACSFADPPSKAVSETLDLRQRLRLVRGEQHPEVWISRQYFPDVEPALARFLATGEVRSAAFLTTAPVPEQRWILSRWPGRLAAHRQLADQVDLRWWTRAADYGLMDLISFAPTTARLRDRVVGAAATGPAARIRQVQTAAEYRASLRSRYPTLIKAPVRQILSRPADWFGDLTDERVGGAIALLGLSGVTTSTRSMVVLRNSMVVLRNPAAFNLDWVTGPGSLASRYQMGQVEVRAIGVSSPGPATDVGTSITLTARSDLDVLLIEAGFVFEQRALNGVQNIAIADSMTLSTQAGRTRTVSLRAWCLNRELTPPNGQLIRPTPFYLPLPAGTTQADVWSKVEQMPDFLRRPQ